MANFMIIRHTVSDFANWKTGFDSHETVCNAAGLKARCRSQIPTNNLHERTSELIIKKRGKIMIIKMITKQLICAVFIMLWLVFVVNAQAKKVETKCYSATELTETEISEILEVHNKARADVDLPPLTWNWKLAVMAQGWVNRGVFEHSPKSNFGENIAAHSANTSPIVSIKSWLLEKSFWDNTAAKCQTGKSCYHYTQVVWKSTTAVGCGINRNASGKMKMLLVCNYDPAGNFAGPAY